MREAAVALILIGAFLLVHALHEQRVAALRRDVRVEYRFIPRSWYEEQLGAPDVSDKFRKMFADPSVEPGR